MLPIFAKPAAPATASLPGMPPGMPPGTPPGTAPLALKKSNKPRVHDEATKCRIKEYESYRKTCSETEKKDKGSCEMVKKCAKHGVGSELWPVEVWHLDDDKFAAVNTKFADPSNPNLRAVDVGKRCMNEVMRGDEKFVKEIEAKCGPTPERKKSVKPLSKKPLASPAAATSKKPVAAVRPASKKPVAAVRPASKKPVAAAKPASKKPVAAKPASKK